MENGVLVRASELTTLLPAHVQSQYEEYVCDECTDEAFELITKHLPGQFSEVVRMFLFGEDDVAKNGALDVGEMYAVVDATVRDCFLPGTEPFFAVWRLWRGR